MTTLDDLFDDMWNDMWNDYYDYDAIYNPPCVVCGDTVVKLNSRDVCNQCELDGPYDRLRSNKVQALGHGKLCVVDNRGTLRRDAKRQLRRARRRLEKLNPENAPTTIKELTRGWVS